MPNMIEAAREQIDSLLNRAYAAAAEKGTLPAGAALTGKIELPKDTKNGDYACSYAMGSAKALHMAPRQIAEALLKELDLTDSWFQSAEAAGAGLPVLLAASSAFFFSSAAFFAASSALRFSSASLAAKAAAKTTSTEEI